MFLLLSVCTGFSTLFILHGQSAQVSKCNTSPRPISGLHPHSHPDPEANAVSEIPESGEGPLHIARPTPPQICFIIYRCLWVYVSVCAAARGGEARKRALDLGELES